MAEIKAFQAWRYHERFQDQLDTLTSPLFDVVSDAYRRLLYANPYNSIHLSSPAGDDPAAAAAACLHRWLEEEVLVREPMPCLYAYEQVFSLPGSHRVYRRKGFICNIRAYPWEAGVVRRHENTIPQAVNERAQILAATHMHSSPTHGLYHDPDFTLEPYLDDALRQPLYQVEDHQGVINRLGRISDPEIIQFFEAQLAPQMIILADGHHRYEASLIYQETLESDDPQHPGRFHPMYLTNDASDDLRILPTHRLLVGWAALEVDDLLQKLNRYFVVRPLATAYDIEEVIAGKRWAFGLILPQGAFKLRLRPEVHERMRWPFPEEVKALDLTVLHYFFFRAVLGIRGRDQRSSPHIRFERNFAVCLDQVRDGNAQAALITNEIEMDEVRRICQSGYTMPQKSTYFYPKVLAGLLFSSINL
ncbi:MAG: DUF1015 domain-containing protein [Bernardetiaceae bacterium]